eukprot:8694064-Alexandrium_andersonii.AAC.1
MHLHYLPIATARSLMRRSISTSMQSTTPVQIKRGRVRLASRVGRVFIRKTTDRPGFEKGAGSLAFGRPRL